MVDRLHEKVDSSGKRSTSGYRGDKTYLQWQAEQVGRQVLDKELSARLAEASKQIKTAATELIGAKIAEVLGRGF